MKQLRAFFEPCSTPLINIVLTKNDIHTLIDIVIAAQYEWIYFPDITQFKDLMPLMWLKPKKETIATNTPLINSSF
jgi:hypothetical protein